jgi:branched-chain amino acid transport system substrate-binding protein
MRSKRLYAACSVAVVGLLAVTACSSSKSAGTSGGGGGSSSPASGGTLKIGVITDSTGVAASGYVTTEIGIKAYVNAVNTAGGVNGQKLSYVMADSLSTPAGALAAAQKLVQTDKVFAIISVTSDMFGAEPYLLKAGVPVVGTGFDGPEWTVKSNTNMFNAEGTGDPGTVYTTTGKVMKALGATTCGAVGYVESPSSSKSAGAATKSCETQGLKSGLVSQVSFGSTDMAPVALSMKSKGVDGIFMGTVPNTGFALAAALRLAGVKPKVFLLATGYGGDLLSSDAAVTAAQGFQFSSTGQPVEMVTPATQKLVANLAAVDEKRTPTFAEQTAYISMAALVKGLQVAGANPTRQKFMDSLRTVSDFDADGLLAPEKIDFSSYTPTQSCSWVVTLQGKKFVPVPGSPFCGEKVG